MAAWPVEWAIAAIAHTSTTPLCALITGTFAGIIAVMGFRYATPKFAKSFKIHDSRGVYSLHALPGIFGALLGVLSIFLHNANDYGDSLPHIYPAMLLAARDVRYPNQDRSLTVDSRNYGGQALMQLAGLGLGILIPVITGAIVGFILRLRF